MLLGLGLDKGSTTSWTCFRDQFRLYGQGCLLVLTVEDITLLFNERE